MRADRVGGYNDSIAVSTVCFGGRLALLDWPSKTYLKQSVQRRSPPTWGTRKLSATANGKSYRPTAFGGRCPLPAHGWTLHDKVRPMFATAENEYQTEDGGNRILVEAWHDSASLRVC